jgi:dTDP-4-dehydrorhamnose reductase
MKVVVIGANGQLGSDVVRVCADQGHAVSTLSHADIEIADPESVSRCLGELGPTIVVNTAAMHHVERCEREPGRAFAVNAIGARNLALAVRELDVPLMHVSTDYVFGGDKTAPYVEEDLPRPLNVYGNSKLAGEHLIRSTTEKYFILRTSGLCGRNPCRDKGGLNFVDLMLKLARERGEVRVVADEVLSPTSTLELARQMLALSASDCYGLYHATAEGACSWYEFAREIFALTNTRVDLRVASPNEFPAKVARPKYSVLENQALKLRGLNTFRSWQEGLGEYLGVGQLCGEGQPR